MVRRGVMFSVCLHWKERYREGLREDSVAFTRTGCSIRRRRRRRYHFLIVLAQSSIYTPAPRMEAAIQCWIEYNE